MDDDDRESVASSENDQDEVMDDVDDNENDNDEDGNDDDVEDEDADADADHDGDEDRDGDGEADGDEDKEPEGDGEGEGNDDEDEDENNADADHDMADDGLISNPKPDHSNFSTSDPQNQPASPSGTSTIPSALRLRPSLRPETITARLYDIVPTMAAPHSTSINAIAVTPDLRYWMTGGADGYIRKYDGGSTINGKLPLTVAQRHPFVDSVFKAGVLMGYWENEEPPTSGSVLKPEEHLLSPVYSLAVHSQALWALSGLDSGCINLQTVRHDEGKRICSLQQHTNAVSVLTLAPDERSVLSGSWDKRILSWDLNTGKVDRSFDGNGGQIAAIELRPAGGAAVPVEAAVEPPPSDTFSSNNGSRPNAGTLGGGASSGRQAPGSAVAAPNLNASAASGKNNPFAPNTAAVFESQPSPGQESFFGGSDVGSLFGDDAGASTFEPERLDSFDTDLGTTEAHDITMTEAAEPEEQLQAQLNKETKITPDEDAAADAAPSAGMMDNSLDTSLFGQPLEQDHISDEPVIDSEAPTKPDETNPPKKPAETAPETKIEPVDSMALDPTESLTQEGVSSTKIKEEAPSQSTSTGMSIDSRPIVLSSPEPEKPSEPGQMSQSTFLSAAIDGTLRIWDRRVANHVAKIVPPRGTPPWCMGTSWSPDGNQIFVGRRNSTVEEYNIHKACSGWMPERSLRFPNGSGAISAVRAMPNGRHLVCSSHDILRLYDLHDTNEGKHSVPFLIIPGPPRAGVISHLYIDPTCRFMISTAGTRGWEGTSTEVLIGYEIHALQK
ncbi:Transcription factor spt8 [Ceratocystis fimbriata CBS 114723]|uniref:Transcription factor spt8 n=1 Tax=Ceratocystis fimbriata CBS 114723 TaxID=1035309 RepID=A0A2C5WVU3_9PEZI|nr:Transcription factor spt8 [Ceratocystis fimbriata CBS 114723]